MPSNLFIGYDLLEEWAEVADPARPAYLMLYVLPERDTMGSRVDHHWLTVSQPDEAHHVHYCRFEVARLEFVYDRPVHAAAHTQEEARVQHETRRAAGPSGGAARADAPIRRGQLPRVGRRYPPLPAPRAHGGGRDLTNQP